MRLRTALRQTLEGWQEDAAPAWQGLVDGVALAFEDVDADLEIEPWEPIFPTRRGRVFPGAPAGAHMLRAFDGLAPEAVRCVVLGQDPYPCPAFSTGRAFEAGNVAHWRELDKMFSPSVRAFVQLVLEARTGEARYAGSFARWPATLATIERGETGLEAPDALADRWEASGILLLNSSLTLTRFRPRAIRTSCAAICRYGARCWFAFFGILRRGGGPSSSPGSAMRRRRRFAQRASMSGARLPTSASSFARTPRRRTTC